MVRPHGPHSSSPPRRRLFARRPLDLRYESTRLSVGAADHRRVMREHYSHGSRSAVVVVLALRWGRLIQFVRADPDASLQCGNRLNNVSDTQKKSHPGLHQPYTLCFTVGIHPLAILYSIQRVILWRCCVGVDTKPYSGSGALLLLYSVHLEAAVHVDDLTSDKSRQRRG